MKYYLFNKLKIVEIIKSHINNEDKFKFMNKEISSDISHGYKSFLINLCYKINTVIGGTPLGVNFNISTEGNFEFTKSVEKKMIKGSTLIILMILKMKIKIKMKIMMKKGCAY